MSPFPYSRKNSLKVSTRAMSDSIFIGKNVSVGNPIENTRYQELLGLHPTLKNQIERQVQEVLFHEVQPLKKRELHDNKNIISENDIENARLELLGELEILAEKTGEAKHIYVVMDTCFTNKPLLLLLRKILGKENYKKYVTVIPIDYTQKDPFESPIMNHSLAIVPGSLEGVYDVHDSYYTGVFAADIREASNDYAPMYYNKKFLGICYGHDLLANNKGIDGSNASSIIATVKGPAQFAPSNCTILDMDYVHPIYRDAMRGLTANGTNNNFSAYFTRSDYVSFDLLGHGGNTAVEPLITNPSTGSIVAWGGKNGNTLCVKFHPEISFTKHQPNLKKNIKKIASSIVSSKEEQDLMVENFNLGGQVKRDIDEAFYVFAILALIKDINKKYDRIISGSEVDIPIPEVSPEEARNRLMDTISKRVDYTLADLTYFPENIMDRLWIDAIDNRTRLLLNIILDWKVSRGLDEVAQILGIKSLPKLIEEHIVLQPSKNYIIRDLGAGDGNTMTELENTLSQENILIYGTGDYVYFDLYSAIVKTEFKDTIPNELLVLFVEKVVAHFKKNPSPFTIEKIFLAMENVSFEKTDQIRNSSMTNKKTLMFESENMSPLSQDILDNFDEHIASLDELKKFLRENIYSLFSKSFKNIYISKFNDLLIEDPVISKIDFQYAIRSTSHVNGREYMKIIADWFMNSAKVGSIYMDNGIHQSYTSIPRLKELWTVSQDLYDARFELVYDKKTNYFSSVIITKENHYSKDFWQKYLTEDTVLVPLQEANKSTFFKLEYFIRNFIIANFKNPIVFWDFNNHIMDALRGVMEVLKNGDIVMIQDIFLNLINFIAENYRVNDIHYNKIDKKILIDYSIDGEKLSDIIQGEIYTPEWMNIEGSRKY